MQSSNIDMFETGEDDTREDYVRLFRALGNNSYVRSISFGPTDRSRVGRDVAAKLMYEHLVWNRSVTRLRFRDASTVLYVLSRLLYSRRGEALSGFTRRLRTMRQLETLRLDGYAMRFYNEQLDRLCSALIENIVNLRYLTITYMGTLSAQAIMTAIDRRAPLSELALISHRRENDVRNMQNDFMGYNTEGKRHMYAFLRKLGEASRLRHLTLELNVDRMPTRRFFSLVAELAGARAIREIKIRVRYDLTQFGVEEGRRAEAFSRRYNASASSWVSKNTYAFGDLYRAIKRNENLLQFDLRIEAARRHGVTLVARVLNEFGTIIGQRVMAPRAANSRERVNQLARIAMAEATRNRSDRWTLANVNPMMHRMVADQTKRAEEAERAYKQYRFYAEDDENEDPEADDF
jgi:hypothetical protein